MLTVNVVALYAPPNILTKSPNDLTKNPTVLTKSPNDLTKNPIVLTKRA